MLYSKSPNEHLKITLSWATELAIDTTTISGVTWTLPSGLTSVSQTTIGTNTILVLTGGVENVEYSIKCRIQTADTKYYEQGVIIQVVASVGQPTNCYASLFDIASDLGISSATNLSRLANLLKQTSLYIESYTGRKFYLQEDLVEKIKADTSTYLFTTHYPLRAVASIVYEGETVDAADYYIASEEISAIRSKDNNWQLYTTLNDNSYTVTYDAGFYLPGQANRDLPMDIEAACASMVKEAWKIKDRDPTISKMSIPQVISLQFKEATVNGRYQASSLLDKYKIWRL